MQYYLSITNMRSYRVALNWFQCEETQDERLITQLYPFSQNFKNKETQEMFIKFGMPKFISLFRICTVLHIILNFIFAITSYTQYNSTDRSIQRAVLTISLTTFLIVQTKIGLQWNKRIDLFILINTLTNQALFIQYFLTGVQDPVQINVAIFSNALYALSSFLICSQWRSQFLILFSYFVQLSGIIQAQLQWQSCLLISLLFMLLRINDKQIKLSFLLLYQQKTNIQACKDVFDQCVPSSILIIKIKEDNLQNSQLSAQDLLHQQDFSHEQSNINNSCLVLYANQFALNYLDCPNYLECAKAMEKIRINSEDKESKIIDLIQTIKQSTRKEMLTYNSEYALGQESEILCCSRIKIKKLTPELDSDTEQNLDRFSDMTIKPCVWEGQKAFLITMTDTTDKLKHITELKELNNYKDQLLATVSHDLKTPLNTTQLMLYTMKEILTLKQTIEKTDIQNMLQYVDDIISNNCMLISMINDLLDYSQIRKGALRLQIDIFTLDDCLKSIKKIFDRQTQQKKLQLLFEKVNFDINIELQTDLNRLKQILINLLSNSLKFTQVGHIKLMISIQDSQLEFIVEDTGIGMPKEVVVKLFQQYQTFNLGNLNSQGVGLGLCISKKLVGLLGPVENILVCSEEGIGTQFSFKIFMRLCPTECDQLFFDQVSSQQPNLTHSTKTLRRITTTAREIVSKIELCNVLIVDDTIFNITVFKAILQKIFKCNVEDAFNGLEAVQKVKSGAHFNLIFMDISMPIMNGYEATKLIRDYENETKNKPSIIIICSAYTLEQEFENLKQSGADGLIEKPISIKKLNEILLKYQFIFIK